jgi:hypothetical protein
MPIFLFGAAPFCQLAISSNKKCIFIVWKGDYRCQRMEDSLVKKLRRVIKLMMILD